ncbi:MAG: TSUP family transporter [Planctomycetota bacterium]|jgi:hypothetical protein
MLEALQSFELTAWGWGIAVLSAVMIGFAKTGVSGAGILVVVLMATVFGGKPSVGLVLPMLCMADIFAVKYYHRHADWRYIWRPMPWAIAGILIATHVGESISEDLFRQVIGGLVLTMLIWGLIRDRQGGGEAKVPEGLWFSALMGVMGGFALIIDRQSRLVGFDFFNPDTLDTGNAGQGSAKFYEIGKITSRCRFISTTGRRSICRPSPSIWPCCRRLPLARSLEFGP